MVEGFRHMPLAVCVCVFVCVFFCIIWYLLASILLNALFVLVQVLSKRLNFLEILNNMSVQLSTPLEVKKIV